MTFFSNNKNISFLNAIILFFCIFTFSGYAQNSGAGIPFIKNFTPELTGFRNNTIDAVTDERGVYYFGNENGIIEFNGNSWNLIHFSGAARFAKTKKGDVFVCGYNQFGCLRANKKGQIQFQSLKDSAFFQFKQPSKMLAYDNTIIFSVGSSVYQYSSTLQKIVSDNKPVSVFVVGSTPYIALSDSGVVELTPAGLLRPNFAKQLTGKTIIEMLSFADNILLATANQLFWADADKIRPFNTDLQAILQQNVIVSIKPITNSLLAIAVKNNGIFLIDARGRLIQTINQSNGLYDNAVNNLFFDGETNLWACCSNGISRIEVGGPYSFYSNNVGLRGRVQTIQHNKQTLYIGTSQGIFTLHNNSVEQISEINCTQIVEYQNTMYFATNKGLYALKSQKLQKIFDGVITSLYRSPQNKFLFVAVDGLLLQFEGNKHIGGLAGFNSPITSMSYDSTGTLWIGTRYEGVFSAKAPGDAIEKANVVHYQAGRGLPKNSDWIDVYSSHKGILFSTYAGLYRFDSHLGRFYKDNLIDIGVTGDVRVSPLVEDENRNLWFSFGSTRSYRKQIAVAWNVIDVQRYTYISQPFNRINNFVCDAVCPDSNLVVWFGGFDGIIRFDFKQLRQDNLSVSTLITKVEIGKDSVLFYNTSFAPRFATEGVNLSHSNNTITFHFATPIIEKDNNIEHQYRLKGFDDDWSDFSNLHTKQYTNLSAGTYEFEVRARNLNDDYSQSAIFKFTVATPIYATWWAIVLYVLTFAFLVFTIIRWRSYRFSKERLRLEHEIAKRTEELLLEKEKTERLLANILPERTVKELKDKGKASSMRFSMVTVLFSDIQGFTKIAEQMSADKLVDELDKFFLQFDRVVDKYNIEKIKTIGDAYMCAGGIPQKNKTNPVEVVLAALEMQYFVNDMKMKAQQQGITYWGLRIGLHTGPVVAGVIGSKKITYDIWGDTVNIANRMESSGEVGRVNVSEDTFLLTNEYFITEYRGKMPVKYKGEIDMYFVNRIRPEYAADAEGIVPNKRFLNKLALLRYDDMEDFVFEKLENELSKKLYYHNIKHTIDVVTHIEIIAREEGVSEEELLLLKSAALFHDSGFTIGYHDHEMLGIQVANEILPRYGFSEEQIKTIGDLIYATRMPHNPKNRLEQMICDADLDYLGRTDYLPVSRDYYEELLAHNMIKKSEFEWNKLQMRFLQSHRYFTNASKRRRNENKNLQLQKIVELDFKFEETQKEQTTK